MVSIWTFYICFSFISFYRLLCAVEGKYLVKEATHELMDDNDNVKEHDELQYINLSCSIPKTTGRGFIEVLWLLTLHTLCSLFPLKICHQCDSIRSIDTVNACFPPYKMMKFAMGLNERIRFVDRYMNGKCVFGFRVLDMFV